MIRGLIETPERIAAMEARIATAFQPPSWDDTATAFLAQFGIEDQGAWTQATELRSIL